MVRRKQLSMQPVTILCILIVTIQQLQPVNSSDMEEFCAAFCRCFQDRHGQRIIDCKDGRRHTPPNIMLDNINIMILTGSNLYNLSASSWGTGDHSKIKKLDVTNSNLYNIAEDTFTRFSDKLVVIIFSGNHLPTEQLIAALKFLKAKRVWIILSSPENYEGVKQSYGNQHIVRLDKNYNEGQVTSQISQEGKVTTQMPHKESSTIQPTPQVNVTNKIPVTSFNQILDDENKNDTVTKIKEDHGDQQTNGIPNGATVGIGLVVVIVVFAIIYAVWCNPKKQFLKCSDNAVSHAGDDIALVDENVA